jgi:hypothetical protein
VTSPPEIGFRSVRRAIALLPLVVVVAAGCGGDDDDSEPLSKAEYIEQADAICSSYTEQLDPIGEEAGAQLQRRDFAAAADTVGEAVEVARPGIEELEALPKPPEDEAVLDQLGELRQQYLALIASWEDATREEDVGRIGAIVREIEEVDERADGIATGYGFQECGQD